jgi:hypothetical protein
MITVLPRMRFAARSAAKIAICSQILFVDETEYDDATTRFRPGRTITIAAADSPGLCHRNK